jgi:hypothetical protein
MARCTCVLGAVSWEHFAFGPCATLCVSTPTTLSCAAAFSCSLSQLLHSGGEILCLRSATRQAALANAAGCMQACLTATDLRALERSCLKNHAHAVHKRVLQQLLQLGKGWCRLLGQSIYTMVSQLGIQFACKPYRRCCVVEIGRVHKKDEKGILCPHAHLRIACSTKCTYCR